MRIMVQAIPNEGVYIMECNLCGPLGITPPSEDEVRDAITQHMADYHQIAPEGYLYNQPG